MIIVRRKLHYGMERGTQAADEVELQTFDSWDDAFLYLECKVGPLDHETRKRAQRLGFLNLSQYEDSPKPGLRHLFGDRIPVSYVARLK